jgi:uncharacterized membrane protein YsdA (DUF1294 family)
MQGISIGLLTPILWTSYLLIMNLIAFIGMWWDKRKARQQDWRVSEGTLYILTFIGGVIGIIAGMYKFRHKTQKRSFQAVVFIGLLISLFLYYYTLTTWISLMGPAPPS